MKAKDVQSAPKGGSGMFLPEELAWIAKMESQLPVVMAREEVRWLLGGMVRSRTLANADSRGTGPARPFKVGRKIVYRTRELLEWVVSHLGVTELEGPLLRAPRAQSGSSSPATGRG